jgi:C-terminal processing protease CtpA/Prc
MNRCLLLACALTLGACSSLVPTKLPEKEPPLADMEEPLALVQEPKDEAARVKLPLGGFTGVTVGDARRTLDETEGEPAGVRVARVVENSPADAAGLEVDDLLVEVTDAAGHRQALDYPSQWRETELAAKPGSVLHVVVDRAGVERKADVGVVARVRPPERQDTTRLREESRVGVVLRSATEVEARGAGLGPGGGAVVVGLAAGSPWRAAGLRFGDLITSIDGKEVAHPQVVLDAIRDAPKNARFTIGYAREGRASTTTAAVSRRATELSHVNIPVLFSYDADRGDAEWTLLLGLASYKSTIAAWQLRLLWLIRFGGGDADKLVDVKP